jgi:hypothetical protein
MKVWKTLGSCNVLNAGLFDNIKVGMQCYESARGQNSLGVITNVDRQRKGILITYRLHGCEELITVPYMKLVVECPSAWFVNGVFTDRSKPQREDKVHPLSTVRKAKLKDVSVDDSTAPVNQAVMATAATEEASASAKKAIEEAPAIVATAAAEEASASAKTVVEEASAIAIHKVADVVTAATGEASASAKTVVEEAPANAIHEVEFEKPVVAKNTTEVDHFAANKAVEDVLSKLETECGSARQSDEDDERNSKLEALREKKALKESRLNREQAITDEEALANAIHEVALEKISAAKKTTDNNSAAERVEVDDTLASQMTETAEKGKVDNAAAERARVDAAAAKNSEADTAAAQQRAVNTAMKKLEDMPRSWSEKLFGFKNAIMLACGMSISLTLSMKSCSIGHT